MKKIKTKGMEIYTYKYLEDDYISLTDIARYRNKERTDYLIQNWMRNKDTIEFLGLWESLNNQNFKPVEFEGFKNSAGSNSFSLTPKHWICSVGAIGIISKSGRHGGGTFAHKDIAFEFAAWISAEFKLYLIKEFQRLKNEENQKLASGWEAKRILTKINYKIHTESIKNNIIIPNKLSRNRANVVYANEADILNKALFGLTAEEWRSKNKAREGNLRDYANIYQLVCLANLETLNSEFIKMGLNQTERLIKLNEIAISQMKSLQENSSFRKLK